MIPFLIAYIDPGILSVAIQGFFAALFAIMSGYVLLPWQWLARCLGMKPRTDQSQPPANVPTNQPSDNVPQA